MRENAYIYVMLEVQSTVAKFFMNFRTADNNSRINHSLQEHFILETISSKAFYDHINLAIQQSKEQKLGACVDMLPIFYLQLECAFIDKLSIFIVKT